MLRRFSSTAQSLLINIPPLHIPLTQTPCTSSARAPPLSARAPRPAPRAIEGKGKEKEKERGKERGEGGLSVEGGEVV